MSPLLLGILVGFSLGFGAALFAARWGFHRGIEVKYPELLIKPKSPGKVEFADINSTAR